MSDSEPYKQFVYHFHHVNSINVHKIKDHELEYCLNTMNRKFSSKTYAEDKETAKRMIENWFPEYLI